MNQKFEKLVHSRVFIILLILIFICMTLLLGTYAWFTWSSTDNTSLTMTIGKMADVVFTRGNDISTGLTPVYNYYDGASTEFNIINRDTTGATVSYSVKLNITTIDAELINEHVKYVLVKNDAIIKQGDLSSASDGTSITLETNALSTGTTSYVFYLYIDGNEENDLSMIGKTITGTITVEALELEPTALTNFTYYLGSEYPTVDTINYYSDSYDDYYDIEISSIELEENEILLTKYTGDSADVVIPDTYTIDGVTYNVVILSDLYLFYDDGDGVNIDEDVGIFQNNTNIESIFLGDNIKTISNDDDVIENSMNDAFSGCTNLVSVLNIPNSVIDMSSAFSGCTNLVNVTEIPSTVTDMEFTFNGCTSLVNAPKIPSSVISMYGTFSGCTNLVNVTEIPSTVTDMDFTFYGCTSLVNAPEIPSLVTSLFNTFSGCTSLVNAPEIPSLVTDMNSTFSGCTSLVTAPKIPSSVTSMSSTFYGCTSLVIVPAIPNSVTDMNFTFYNCTNLVNAPEIPSSVTSMTSTFSKCTSLTGTVRINSSNVSAFNHIFYGTSKAITVQVPANSTTYTNISALTTSNGMPSNVTLTTFE